MFFWHLRSTNSHELALWFRAGLATHTRREAVQRPGDLFQTRYNGDLKPDYGP